MVAAQHRRACACADRCVVQEYKEGDARLQPSPTSTTSTKYYVVLVGAAAAGGGEHGVTTTLFCTLAQLASLNSTKPFL